MAFVTRSPREKPFAPKVQESPSTLQVPIEKRIHQGVDSSYRKILNTKDYHERPQTKIVTQSDFHEQQTTANTIEYESPRKNTYDFKKMNKRNPKQKSIIITDRLEDSYVYYDLPGCLSNKTMVKYTASSPSSLFKTDPSMPGPGTYDPKLPPCEKSPIFHRSSTSLANLLLPSEQPKSPTEQKENNLQAYYKTSSSSMFKKPPNLLSNSNKLLLQKLLPHQVQNSAQQQYETIQCLDTFTPAHTLNKDVGNSLHNTRNGFGTQRRFKTVLPDGSNKFYINSNINTKQDQGKSAIFVSNVQRLPKYKQNSPVLQYQNYQKSMIVKTKNRIEIPFDSVIERNKQIQKIDSRPFYDVKTVDKNRFMTKIINNQIQSIHRQLQDETPGPGEYNIQGTYKKKFSCRVEPSLKSTQQTFLQKSPKNSQKHSFLLAHPETLSKVQEKKRPVLKRSPPKPKPRTVVKVSEPIVDRYYETMPSWEKKSYNVLFSSELLPANNPIKNKNL